MKERIEAGEQKLLADYQLLLALGQAVNTWRGTDGHECRVLALLAVLAAHEKCVKAGLLAFDFTGGTGSEV